MPPPEDLSTTKLDARSSIANYLNNISKGEYKAEKRLYEEKEPLSQSKSWDKFVRLAISRQCLEGRSDNAKVEIRDGDDVLLRTGKREKNILGFDKREDPRLTCAIANLDQRAWEYAKEGSKAYKSGSRHSHHESVEENAPRGHSKRGKTILVESHHVRRRHSAGEQDAESRRGAPLGITAPPPRRAQIPLNYDDGYDRTPLQGRRDGPEPPQEYVYPAAPPIMITIPSRSSEPQRNDYRPSPQRQNYQPPPQHHDYQPLPQRQDFQPPPQMPAQTRSHLSPADAPSMSGGRRPPAPMAPSLSELDPHRADRLPERRESASRSSHGNSNRPSDRHSQGGGSVYGSRRDDYSQGGGSIHGSRRDGNARVESWAFGSSDGARPAGRQWSRQFEVGRQSIHSGSNADSDESWDSKATVGVPNWGSGGGESRVSDRHTGRASDRRYGRMSERGSSRGHDRSEHGP